MMDYQQETIETLRQLTLQIMLISAGVFGIVGGFVSTSDRSVARRGFLAAALILFAVSTLAGYVLHGFLISQLNAQKFDPFTTKLTLAGLGQIGAFILGGLFFTAFVIRNLGKR